MTRRCRFSKCYDEREGIKLQTFKWEILIWILQEMYHARDLHWINKWPTYPHLIILIISFNFSHSIKWESSVIILQWDCLTFWFYNIFIIGIHSSRRALFSMLPTFSLQSMIQNRKKSENPPHLFNLNNTHAMGVII